MRTGSIVAGVIAAFIALRADLRRRRLSPFHRGGWNVLTAFDVAAVAVTTGLAVALLLLPNSTPARVLYPPAAWAILACVAALLFLWTEGRRQVQLQRPSGIVFAEWLVLFGIYEVLAILLLGPVYLPDRSRVALVTRGIAPVAIGSAVLALLVPRFTRRREEHRILDRIAAQGEFVQSEWVPATPECPHPEHWRMLDAQSAELEVLDLLHALVIAVKPRLIVETGTFIGHSTIRMAEGLKQNGFGRIIAIEYDPAVLAKAKQNIETAGLADWIECRNASSLDAQVAGEIDMLYSDSDVNIREQEVRRFLPQIRPRGLVLVHDASSHFKVVRDAALRLEREGLLSVVLLSTPRGLVVAQKREGRT